jgi:hypothetical protein
MKVYTGQFRTIADNETEVVVGTTVECVEQGLIVMMTDYIEWVNDVITNTPETYRELQELGWEPTHWRNYDTNRRPCKNKPIRLLDSRQNGYRRQ